MRHPTANGAPAVSARGPVVRQVEPDGVGRGELAAWWHLYREQRQPANPFLSPTWSLAWLRHYVRPADRRLLLVLDDGELVAVAPMAVQRLTAAGLPLARRMVLAGGGSGTPLEQPGVLTAPGRGRAVVRALVRHLVQRRVDWAELSLAAEQGWLAAGPADGDLPALPLLRHVQARASVVKELDGDWDSLRRGLRRNAREALRRSRNRLDGDGRAWKVAHLEGAELTGPAVERWLALHRARAEHGRASSRHRDAYGDRRDRDFMTTLLPQLAGTGEASLVELQLDGTAVASQLVLHAPGTLYLHSSGFDPGLWRLAPLTAVLEDVMRTGVDRGARWLDLSPGPNEAKLRWSERLEVRHEFAFAAAGRAAGARFSAFALAQEAVSLRAGRRASRARPGAPSSPPAPPGGH